MLEIIKKCGKNCLSTYLVIKSHKNKKYDSCYPSLKVIANECNCSTRTIQRDIATLTKDGFLYVTSGFTGKNSNYFFIKETDLYTKEEMEIIMNIKNNELYTSQVKT